jgi:hypothetical protein
VPPLPHHPCALPALAHLPHQVFCLLHKMDLIAEDQRDLVFAHKEQEIKGSSTAANVSCFKTSIWDETLCVHLQQQIAAHRDARVPRYKAWSQIVYSLIPNVDQLERQLERFAKTCAADEVMPLHVQQLLRLLSMKICQRARQARHCAVAGQGPLCNAAPFRLFFSSA